MIEGVVRLSTESEGDALLNPDVLHQGEVKIKEMRSKAGWNTIGRRRKSPGPGQGVTSARCNISKVYQRGTAAPGPYGI